jgi:hypothetical protein
MLTPLEYSGLWMFHSFETKIYAVLRQNLRKMPILPDSLHNKTDNVTWDAFVKAMLLWKSNK